MQVEFVSCPLNKIQLILASLIRYFSTPSALFSFCEPCQSSHALFAFTGRLEVKRNKVPIVATTMNACMIFLYRFLNLYPGVIDFLSTTTRHKSLSITKQDYRVKE